ncbi:hypothetical protein ETD86_50900 [Nonomuraea turkmeniaca]|uniref:Uncharacterized protein n=1 Tax=Nonomuraea turkmeniaca TaxID=103838 RepID=A0A5S4EW31_9ACTN|nr:hypothetical protein [Nonomuraea turkmeniaca]TMR07710.1 hypothetical protein ETD86_50900 [Nonomuraea turkmeniaca]
MDEALPPTLRPVLKDLYADCAVRPTVRFADVQSWEEPFLWLHAPDGSGQGLALRRKGDAAHQIADFADQVQEWAVWVCPQTKKVTAAIGGLPVRDG